MRIRRGATLYGACSEGMLRRMIRNLAQRSLSFSEDEGFQRTDHAPQYLFEVQDAAPC